MKKPLVYYTISLFIGCVSSLLLFKNVIIGAVIAASFFGILFFTIDKKFLYINICFFFIGIWSFMLYFNIKVPKNIDIRIVQKSGYYYLGNYKGRKLLVEGNINKLKEGENVSAYGEFQKDRDFEKGIIGVYKIKNYKCLKKDVICYLYDVKRNIYAQFKENIGEEKASIIMSLCYGDTQYLSKDDKNQFLKLGVFHAVSVSGFHMAIIYEVLEKIIGLRLSIIISFIYMMFTGMQSATVRAFIMILIFKLSKILFKNYDSISSLSLAALILLLIKPYYITDVGFMLSFLATLGMILYYKKMLKALYMLPQKLNESLGITLSSQIFSVPYMAFTIQNFSSGFIVGNLFLLPMYSVIVILGNLALLLCEFKALFKFMCNIINFIMIAINGADDLIIKVCPEVTKLTYLDGAILILIFLSCVFYSYGYKKYKYVPLFLLFFMAIQSYEFIPKIYYIDLGKSQAFIIKYKTESIMICNYEQNQAKSIINLKEEMKVNKVISNVDENYIIKLNDNFYIKIIPYYEYGKINICVYKGKYKFAFINNDFNTKEITAFNSYSKIKLLPKSKNDFNKNDYNYNYSENCTLYVIIFKKMYEVN